MWHKTITLSTISNHPRHNVPKRTKTIFSYWIFAALRILLCIVPQTGYIHPDEFFQSVEVISGHYFDIDTYKPWEFNNTFPVRTILFPYLTVGIPYSILNILLPYSIYYLGVNLKTPYFLIVFPRLFMCIVSFLSDFCLYKICRISNCNYEERLQIFASSYVVLTYVTHTFSNSLELIFMALILYYVTRCMDFSNKVVFRGDHLSKKYQEAKNIIDRVKYYKLLSSLPSHSLNDCLILATVTTAGIFNRSTFLAFAFPVIFFWLQRGLGSQVVGLVDFHIRIITFVICTIPTVIFIISIDSFYFGYLTWGEIGKLEIGINNFVVTPLNFLKYNTNVNNLKDHGLHPKFLHFLINVPLLFNVLGITGIYVLGKTLYRASKKQWLKLPRVQSIDGLMITTFATPIALLSVFPHQEPRFIIPALIPLCFLCAPILSQLTTNAVIRVTREDVNINNHTQQKTRKRLGKLQCIWYICNTFLTLFYGFVHQGGVLPLTSYLASELKAKPELTHVHLFTSYTYSLPTALLHLRNTKKAYISSAKHKYKLVQDFYLHELGTKDLRDVYNEIIMKVCNCEDDYHIKKIPYRIYYAFPASFLNEFMEFTSNYNNDTFNYSVIKTFYPHISTEKLPSIGIWECMVFQHFNNCAKRLLSNPIENFFMYIHQFGFVLLKIEHLNNNKSCPSKIKSKL